MATGALPASCVSPTGPEGIAPKNGCPGGNGPTTPIPGDDPKADCRARAERTRTGAEGARARRGRYAAGVQRLHRPTRAGRAVSNPEVAQAAARCVLAPPAHRARAQRMSVHDAGARAPVRGPHD